MLIPRQIKKEVIDLSKGFPIITIKGPRQSGKTTLAKEIFKHKPYVSLEDPDERRYAIDDPRSFLSRFPEGAILDEIQRTPALLSYIQGVVDKNDIKGMFILTGSHQLDLHQAIAQSLAGRTALLNLLPLSLFELSSAKINMTVNEAIIKGGFPRIYKDDLNPTKASNFYFQTYVDKDVRQLINLKDLSRFEKFIRLLAGRIGQLINFESLASDTGVSSNTIKQWISILEASFLVFRLQPYYDNFGKRLIKTSKIYFTDTGLAAYLLGIESIDQLARDPLRGNLIENLVILELIKFRYNQGFEPFLYFFRDAKGHEVDALFQRGKDLIPIAIKAGQTFQPDFLKNINYFKTLTNKVIKEYLIYSGDTLPQYKGTHVLNLFEAYKVFQT